MTLSLTRRQRKALGKLGAILINLPFVFLIMIPLLYTFMMSVMPADELYSRFWPSHADFSSYLSVFTKTMIPRHILNSFIVAGSVTILTDDHLLHGRLFLLVPGVQGAQLCVHVASWPP